LWINAKQTFSRTYPGPEYNKIMPLLILVLIGCIARLVLLGSLHYRYPTLSIMRNTVSDYGADIKSRKLFIASGISSVLAYVFLFSYLLTEKLAVTWPIYSLGVGIIGSVLILFYPTDMTDSQKLTKTGVIHWLLAIINFTAIFVFIVNVSQPDSAVLTAATWLVRITFYAFVLVVIIPKLRRVSIGLFERLFLVSIPVWLIIYSLSYLLH